MSGFLHRMHQITFLGKFAEILSEGLRKKCQLLMQKRFRVEGTAVAAVAINEIIEKSHMTRRDPVQSRRCNSIIIIRERTTQ